MKAAVIPGLFLVGATALGAASVSAAPIPAPARQEQLRALVTQDCGSCHGMTRKGGLGSPLLAENLAGIGDEALVATILDGRPGTPMPPWRALLSEDDALWIVHHLKGEMP
ncbi:c-type cytochrome [Magnetospirillum aberrantis]|uniref:Cytochrome c n=1 Tax=Magnetospirillum aberrantis SpK TaxID=908842 RepID=A0A7C9UY22_9PROT|nr:cytochrome c [Magnetospirillum aberrantis]NFV79575.1 cytochrome c [Magnetospirillum aberrantis SpK]